MKRLALALLTLTVTGSISAAHASPQARAAHVAYVALGDGLTLGSDSYVGLLAKHLPRGAGHRNLAIPYGTLADVLAGPLPTTLALHPRLVTIWLGGGNDGRVNTDPATYKKELRRLLAALEGIHAKVFIGTDPNPLYMPFFKTGDGSFARGAAKGARAFNAAIVAVATSHGATVVDIYSATKRIWGNPSLAVSDGLHLTTAGEAAIAAIFYEVMHRKGAL